MNAGAPVVSFIGLLGRMPRCLSDSVISAKEQSPKQ
jgi:hypothetical protein